MRSKKAKVEVSLSDDIESRKSLCSVFVGNGAFQMKGGVINGGVATLDDEKFRTVSVHTFLIFSKKSMHIYSAAVSSGAYSGISPA